ncbi:hypothetical protein [Kerstersia gyiorum]|uniref:hypothetical protein n=1 Tax=Kerstersia gyiorum TaxID=206506 RepID=UPI00209FD498|nr:hypothetical protein [Kerstersia gyiorum]MCP1679416.1 hypothetical protein [Kerstersia gyiorum]MCP1823919.1 hypothetical protein [Kerstersia gyiorum]MCP1827360.1 hypothetical protein [Kerstersia gyiorum]MCW2448991.1 hypothetical protein [Kerstersia gyiorum]
MQFQEYPKALYRGEEFCTVPDAPTEQERRADGWHSYGQEPAAASDTDKPRRGRPPKATAAGEA